MTDSDSIKPATQMQYLPGVGPSRALSMEKLGIQTAQQLLFFFPRDYEFPAPPLPIEQIQDGEACSLIGQVSDVELISRTPGKSIVNAIVVNETGAVKLLFFNQPFRADQLILDQRVLVSGVPKMNGLKVEFTHPKVVLINDDEELPKPEILPIYSLTDGIKQAELRRIARLVVNALSDSLKEVLPLPLREKAAAILNERETGIGDMLAPIETAIRNLHFPSDQQALFQARTRLIFQECLVLQLALAIRQRRLSVELKSPVLESSAMIDARIKNRFPFSLTNDQERVIREIRDDLSRPFPMNRLLQGDVGSGKTVVAIYAMMLAVANQRQAVLMAPTEVLARQHYNMLRKMLKDSRVNLGLLCGSLATAERRRVLDATKSGEIEILIGTQALLHAGVKFKCLGVAVVDEQHKFGVAQRELLRSGGEDPHYLVMSATPIPRSVAMTLFGDVELSTLRETPPGRGKVHTYLSHQGWKDRWWIFARQKLDEGRQVYVVAPMIKANRSESSKEGETTDDREDTSSVETVFEDLCNGPLSDYRVGLLHGRMNQDRKQRVMEDFNEGKIQVLVSTTVIEVGIDVSNATVMTILGAQQFGLAQLHQLRGRVSRGVHEGHVCIFTDGEDAPEENERLKIFSETSDGFDLAEADFQMRGPGDFFGKSQSGLPPLRIADLQRDFEIMKAARVLAKQCIRDGSLIESDAWNELRGQVMRRYGKRLDLGDLA